MALDPQTQTLLDEVNALDATPAWELPLWKARAGFEALTLTWAPERLVVPCVESLGIPGPHGSIPLRIYWPEAVDAGGAPPPPLPDRIVTLARSRNFMFTPLNLLALADRG